LNGGKNLHPKNSPYQILTPKKSHAEFLSLKNFHKALNNMTRKIKFLKTSLAVLCLQNYAAGQGYTGTITNLQIVLKYPPKNPYLNYETKKILVKISNPKIFRNEPKKFQTPPKIIRLSPSLEIQSSPRRGEGNLSGKGI